MSIFSSPRFDYHEGVHVFSDEAAKLQCVIAVHSTHRGPAAGGVRIWSYEDGEHAINDALNLARAMSYKNAMADLDHGGGKAVIMAPKGDYDREALFTAFGRAIQSLGGVYYTAEDVGVTPQDMDIIHRQTAYVAGLDHGEAASGDPSPVTAKGVFLCQKLAAKIALGRSDMKGLRVAIQGLGSVGYYLAQNLHQAGAELIVTDIDQAVIDKAIEEFGVKYVAPDIIHKQDVDIYAPCALGGAVNPETIKDISAPIIAGAANNQLTSQDMGALLQQKGILYCPDYVINAGGIINVAAEISGTYDPVWIENKLDTLTDTLGEIIAQSQKTHNPTNVIADHMAKGRIGR